MSLTTLHFRPDRYPNDTGWNACRFLTCSVLPVRFACNCSCPFCFSKSSLSALRHDSADWQRIDLERYFEFSRERGASRLVITGGGEPLLNANAVLDITRRGSRFFDEIACFTNGKLLTSELARQLADAGLSYVCFSRHHFDEASNRELMGNSAPTLQQFFGAAQDLTVRATCVMASGMIDSVQLVWDYINRLAEFGVRQFTFKHTYVAYEDSVFTASAEDRWAAEHRVAFDPFGGTGEVIGELPWGPSIRRVGDNQVCYYYEPTPNWEQEHQLCRSVNLLSDGTVFASLEDQSSRLFRLNNSLRR
ncbi:MAG: radical SAM protein [Planctomycetales bacterium]|nr:radical SAM protein [Planctomycetales bacterium]